MRRAPLQFTLIRILVVLSLLNLGTMTPSLFAATCTGADPCHACKNCKYCKHCAKQGGTCGVCKRNGAVATPAGAKQ
jgi:hypothetical protein